MRFRILYEDSGLVAIDKPAGFFTHAPEEKTLRIHKRWNCHTLLQEQLQQEIYPCHRLDRATSGILLFTKNKEAASFYQSQFQARSVEKRYVCLVRGHTAQEARLDSPLKREDGSIAPALTLIRTLFSLELPYAFGRYESCRLSWVEAFPHTGRFHQIRRHLAQAGHPILGDTRHGDKKWNRFLEEKFEWQGLCLRARSVELDGQEGKKILLQAPWRGPWHKLFDHTGFCPWP